MPAFGAETTGEEVIAALNSDLSAKNVVVTGASAGIGAEAARVLAKAGATVYAFGRNVEKTQLVADAINGECGRDAVLACQCDVLALDTNRARPGGETRDPPPRRQFS